jgi:hypothetical protein
LALDFRERNPFQWRYRRRGNLARRRQRGGCASALRDRRRAGGAIVCRPRSAH